MPAPDPETSRKRLQELEAELERSQGSVTPTSQPKPLKQNTQLLLTIAKVVGVAVGIIIAIRIAVWAATLVIVGGLAWVAYKVFFEPDPKA